MTSASAPAVVVVVLNYNGWRNTIECLESVLRSDYRAVRALVVDNGSTDGSREAIRAWAAGEITSTPASPELAHLSMPPTSKPLPILEYSRSELEQGRVIDWTSCRLAVVDGGKNLGFTRGNNVALRYILRAEPGSLALLLNNDTVIGRDAIGLMAETALRSKGGLTAVGATILQYHVPGRVETLGGNTLTTWLGMSGRIGWNARRDVARPEASMDYVSGCCLMIPHATLERVGLLDERFFIYSEDADWGLRARRAGVRLSYSPGAEIWHKGSATVQIKSTFHDYHNAKSVLHFAYKHRPRTFTVALAYLSARLTLAKIARGEWDRLRAVIAAFRDFFGERETLARELGAFEIAHET